MDCSVTALVDCPGHVMHQDIRLQSSLPLQRGALPLHCLLAMQVIVLDPGGVREYPVLQV